MKERDKLIEEQTDSDDSYEIINCLYEQLKLLRIQLYNLEQFKPFWFQKKRMKEYLEEKKELEELMDTNKRILMSEMKFQGEFLRNIKQQG